MAFIYNAQDSFTRPADTTAYADGDLVANSTTAGSVVPMSFNIPVGEGRGIRIRQVKLQKSGTGVAAADFIVNFYSSSPTPANGDNGAYSTDLSGYMGVAVLSTMRAFTDGAAVVEDFSDTDTIIHVVKPGQSGVIYALVEANGAYTPASSEVFTLDIDIEIVAGG